MTLRDYFAGQALVGLLSNTRSLDDESADSYAIRAYGVADAMIKRWQLGDQSECRNT